MKKSISESNRKNQSANKSQTRNMLAKTKDRSLGLSRVLVKLLQGFIMSDEKKHWEALLTHQDAVRDYFSMLKMRLYLSVDDGYAFLKPIAGTGDTDQDGDSEGSADGSDDVGGDGGEEPENELPSLVRKFPLSFEVSLLCVLLREALEQFEAKVSDDHRLILSKTDIYDLLKQFYDEKTDETKQVRRYDALINKVMELGFLKELKNNQDSYEVRRLIKAQMDAEKLSEIKNVMLVELGRELAEPVADR